MTQQLAQIKNPAIDPSLGGDAGSAAAGNTFTNYFIVVWQAIIAAGALAVLIYFLWGAFEWIVAGNDSGKVQKARDKMTNAVIGLILLVGSFAIISFISSLIGYDILQVTFPAA